MQSAVLTCLSTDAANLRINAVEWIDRSGNLVEAPAVGQLLRPRASFVTTPLGGDASYPIDIDANGMSTSANLNWGVDRLAPAAFGYEGNRCSRVTLRSSPRGNPQLLRQGSAYWIYAYETYELQLR